MVFVLYLGLAPARRVVARLPQRRPRICRADGTGRPVQAGFPAGAGRDQGGQCRTSARCHGDPRQDHLSGARPGARGDPGQAARRQARRPWRSRAGRGRPGAAGADAQHQLGPARCHAAAARLWRGNVDRADGNHWPPPLRAQGGARRRWRRQEPDARAVRHAAAVEPARAARCRRPRQPGSAAQRFADQLPHRRRGRPWRGPLRDRQRHHRRHAGPAGDLGPAAAGARGRPLPRHVHAAQYHEARHDGAGERARHAARQRRHAAGADRADSRG
ncbi:hypothetical protein FQZ97_479220 [compost metagenome]